MIESFLSTFESIYIKVNGNPNFSLRRDDKNIKLVTNFINRCDFEVGQDFLFDYIVLQFEYYKDKKTRMGEGNVQLSWITGDKGLNRWRNKGDRWKYWNDQFCKTKGITKSLPKYEINKEGRNLYEKQERKRFFNTERGLIHCIENDLYNQYNRECIVCKHKNICNERSL